MAERMRRLPFPRPLLLIYAVQEAELYLQSLLFTSGMKG